VAVAFLIFGVSMILQLERWSRTGAYYDLLQILPGRWWGAIYLFVGTLLAIAAWRISTYWLVVAATTLGLMLSFSWSAAFVVRMVTNMNTTPETFVSFLAFAYLLLQAGIQAGRSPETLVGPGP
jgi:hypothetical protein